MCQKLKSPNQPCDFIKVPQSEPINALMRARKIEYDNPTTDPYTLEKSFGCGSNRKVIVTLPPNYKFSDQTKKTLAFLLWRFQESQSPDLEFVLKDFCKFCKLKDITKARSTLQKELELISGLGIIWEGSIPIKNEKTGKAKKPSDSTRHNVSLIKSGSCFFPKGRSQALYKISWSDEFYKMLQVWGFMYVPSSLFQFSSNHHPNTLSLGWSLCAYVSMNSKEKEKVWCLTLESLIDSAGIISYQEEGKNQRHYKKNIMDPITKALDDLNNTCGLSYGYVHKQGNPISEQEEDEILKLDYSFQDFIKLKIYYAFPDMPQHQTKRKRTSANKKKKSGQLVTSKEDPLFLFP